MRNDKYDRQDFHLNRLSESMGEHCVNIALTAVMYNCKKVSHS